MKKWIFIALLTLTSVSCSSSRWVVTDKNTIDTSVDAEIVGEKEILLLQKEPTVDDPVIGFEAYKVLEKRYAERVKVERSVQKYRPKWEFLAVGLSGAAFAVLAANTNSIIPAQSVNQKFAFNLAAGILTTLSFSNLEPAGDPIFTGESKLKRKSGTRILEDTVRTSSLQNGLQVNLEIIHNEEVILSRSDINLNQGRFDINLGTLSDELTGPVDENSSVQLNLGYNGSDESYTIPVRQFLVPYVTITEPVASLRNAPSQNELNLVTEVGEGSTLQFLGPGPENWYRVRFGGSEVFVSSQSGNIEWMSSAETIASDVIEFEEIPFGEIDVENSVPVLKPNNPDDRALILTLGSIPETRQYLERDKNLVNFYFRYALQMDREQITVAALDSIYNPVDAFSELSGSDSTGTFISYVTGSALVDTSGSILIKSEENGMSLSDLLSESIDKSGSRDNLLLIDLDYTFESTGSFQGEYTSIQQKFSNRILREHPNSAVIFSHRPDQRSSLYVRSGIENKRHDIFTYYLAEALKRRKSSVSEIIRHLESNVDYTSRRLHDRSQEIQAYGNFTIDLGE